MGEMYFEAYELKLTNYTVPARSFKIVLANPLCWVGGDARSLLMYLGVIVRERKISSRTNGH